MAILTAFSKSASEKMMSGDFPPNSRETFLTLETAAECMICLPTSVDPVKPTYGRGGGEKEGEGG